MYLVRLAKPAERRLERIRTGDPAGYRRIAAAIEALADNPRPERSFKLSGVEAWRIRVGEYRVLYRIQDQELLVLVINVAPRGEVYR